MGVNGIFRKRRSVQSDIAHAEAAEVNRFEPSRLPDAHERLAMLNDFEESGLGWFWATDSQGRLTYISDSAARKVGMKRDRLIGSQLTSLFVCDTIAQAEGERPLVFMLNSHSRIVEKSVQLSCDKEIWWSVSAKPKLDSAGNFLGYRGSAKDVTTSRASERDASRLAEYDSLTGLANRHRMVKRLETTLSAYKAAKRSCALIMIDLDRFKQVNDTLGHPAGDELLKQVAQRLLRIVDKRGEIGRLGGDEFQVILPDIDDRGTLGELAARIIQMISQPYSIEGTRAIIGTSAGIAIAPYDGIDSGELAKAADLALYAAKGGGRGQYRFYSSDLKDEAEERREIEEELRDALHRGELEMHYQPFVGAEDHMVKGFEALMRWNHPERGPVSPSQFIPIAEEGNLIIELGKWALRKACEDAKSWPADLRVAVNVSAVQFSMADFPNVVANALALSGLDPRCLELEITESVLVDTDAVNEMIKQLRGLGVRLSLDDFGTGYSSLGYLSKVRFDKIKIDQSFVRGSTEAETSKSAIISAVVSLGRAMDMEITAEGVEAMDELALVKDRGATHVQGYIFCKAITQQEVVEKLASGDFGYEPHGPEKHRSDRRTLLRRVGVIHEDHHYDAVMRNLSKTGAMIEGLLNVPVGTDLVLDLGGGQLAVATVRRSEETVQGVEFETPLISDGADGLVTRHRVSPYALAAAGMPLAALPPGHYQPPDQPKSLPKFMQIELSFGPQN
ncbi:MAG TPA: EAL domain-containing protein [Alteraurantiacibacter sp.]